MQNRPQGIAVVTVYAVLCKSLAWKQVLQFNGTFTFRSLIRSISRPSTSMVWSKNNQSKWNKKKRRSRVWIEYIAIWSNVRWSQKFLIFIKGKMTTTKDIQLLSVNLILKRVTKIGSREFHITVHFALIKKGIPLIKQLRWILNYS